MLYSSVLLVVKINSINYSYLVKQVEDKEKVLHKLHLEQKPKEIHIAVVIATPEGIEYLEKNVPENCHLWVAALDEKLNEHNYIVPGLGDAGDLAYGIKL